MLNLKDVTKIYVNPDGSPNEAIHEVSLDVRQHEFVAFVGPSGCGKSTLLKLIAGLEVATRGNVSLDGKHIARPGKERGIVFQSFALFPWLTVYENIAFGLRLRKASETVIQETVSRYLKITGLEHFRDRYPMHLSGGMQQRVAIARTLANDPELLLLDEPMAALDVQTRSQLQEFLAQMLEQEKKTTILVTHDVEEAIYLADRVFVLSTRPGTIKEVVEINIPRPRRPEMRFDENFLRLKKHISYVIRSEAIKAALDKDQIASNIDLRVGLDAWLGNVPFYVAKDLGFFAHHLLEATVISSEKHIDRVEALERGDIDVLNMSLDSAVLLKDRFPDIRIAMVLDKSVGADAIVANQKIHSFKDLKGKKIAVETMWVSHFVLLYVLAKHGMSAKDVKIVDVKGSDIGSALISGKVDAGVVWEPWLSKVVELKEFHVLESSSKLPIIYDVLVARKSTIESKSREIKKLYQSWHHALAFMKKEKDEAIRIGSSYVGISERELQEGLDKIGYTEKIGSTTLAKMISETQKTLLAEGVLKNAFPPEELIDLVD